MKNNKKMNVNAKGVSKLAILAISGILSLNACQKDNQMPDAASKSAKLSESVYIAPDQYIVEFKDGVISDNSGTYSDKQKRMTDFAQNVLKEHNPNYNTRLIASYSSAIHGFAAKLDASTVAKLKNDSRIAFVEPDRVVSLGKGNHKTSTTPTTTTTQPAQVTPWGITRVGGPGTTSSKTAWILDTGIDPTHPDLNVDQTRSKTFLQSGNAGTITSPWDEYGHGTMCAGIIAANNNTIGVVGVSPGSKVVSVRVLDANGSGYYSSIINGLDYVTANASFGDVANMSLGGPQSSILDDAVLKLANAGIKVAVAAGNSSTDCSGTSPADVNHANVYTASAMSSGDIWASFSNYNSTYVDYCEPGVSIKSTFLNGGYNTWDGTSFAAPHIAGILLSNLAAGSGSLITTNGYVSGDPDGTADPIGHR